MLKMAENKELLYHFIQFKLLAPDAIEKCQSINNEEKNGQTIYLDKYNSRDFSNIMNIINTLKTINCMKMNKNKSLNNNLKILIEKNKLVKNNHSKTLGVFNSLLNIK